MANPIAHARAQKPAFNGKNSQASLVPPKPSAAPANVPRTLITGGDIPKNDTNNLPMNRARAIFAKMAGKRTGMKEGYPPGT